MTSNNNSTDDGSLSFLNIQPDEANKHFNCPETTQQKLINLQFWLIDFIEDVKTKFGANRFLVKIKFKKDDPESEAKKFFTNSSEIKSIVRRKIKDTRLLNLLDEIIDSAEGLPIGNYLSQYLANLVLTYFDHWVKEVKRVRYYFRYADDIVVLHSDKKTLHALLAEFESYLAANVKLEIKQNKQVFPVARDHRDSFGRGIDFLGYVFYLNETRLRKRIKQNLCRKIAKLRKRKKPLSEDEFKQTLAAWWGWAKYSDSEYLINKLNKITPYEIKFRR